MFLFLDGEWKSNPLDDESLARLEAFRTLSSRERAWPKALCKAPMLQFDPARLQTIPPVLIPPIQNPIEIGEASDPVTQSKVVNSVPVVITEPKTQPCEYLLSVCFSFESNGFLILFVNL